MRWNRPRIVLSGVSVAAGVALLCFGLVAAPRHISPDARNSLVSAAAAASTATETGAPTPTLHDFIEIENSCDIHYAGGDCVVARAAPATTSPVRAILRNGIVLEVASTTTQANGHYWYQVVFDTYVRYPERLQEPWYVAADYVRFFTDVGDVSLTPEAAGAARAATTTKYIVIDRAKETLSAYDSDTLFMESPVSTGLELTPTPRGTFIIYRKMPSSYMQGPLPGISDQYYDLPGVPWDMYFTDEGGAIHGAYWHNAFGQEWSHGCVNLPLEAARKLYYWAPMGTNVYVTD